MWSAIGYALCSYGIPVWLGAESEIPKLVDNQPVDIEAIKRFNAEADRRFNNFCQKMKI